MAKERKCRLSTHELEIHRQAVKLRKMTDEQLIQAFNESKSASNDCSGINTTYGIKELINELYEGKCSRVGTATAGRIELYCKEKGLI